jgi:hypothetical protein
MKLKKQTKQTKETKENTPKRKKSERKLKKTKFRLGGMFISCFHFIASSIKVNFFNQTVTFFDVFLFDVY